ncbi:indole-3-glycerol phosphate synthase TrpC [Companilactobacillus ginsenosidimutans]|uniref:Indole-3-glycerol phosphate synthase n=1 Tax=Companilactobacillus ginsenosidimutans TaxID=1007676 RepID=A0A0H4QHX7_9LACO|nr:indole-3-glycerol phosphate synthase TrpC [Companilactobacillus ginsenosidimutans]AKP68004.1 indole-3-glycerol phosphate synthase [Companilactobacillus ginsenosidimutans]
MILDDLVAATTKRINAEKAETPLVQLQAQADKLPNKNPQEIVDKFLQPGLHFIAEIKRSSPSKGTIVTDFPYLQIAKDYQDAKIDAISVLTEPDYFHGNLQYLNEISNTVQTPLLRKDFTIDPYMLYQAKINGASLVLLIVAILTDEQLNDYLKLADELGLAALVEVHNEDELNRALKANAKIIGVNNRNLKDFTVDLNNSINLRPLVPEGIPFITESGIKTTADIKRLKDARVNGVLIGETFMRADNKEKIINEFKSV